MSIPAIENFSKHLQSPAALELLALRIKLGKPLTDLEKSVREDVRNSNGERNQDLEMKIQNLELEYAALDKPPDSINLKYHQWMDLQRDRVNLTNKFERVQKAVEDDLKDNDELRSTLKRLKVRGINRVSTPLERQTRTAIMNVQHSTDLFRTSQNPEHLRQSGEHKQRANELLTELTAFYNSKERVTETSDMPVFSSSKSYDRTEFPFIPFFHINVLSVIICIVAAITGNRTVKNVYMYSLIIVIAFYVFVVFKNRWKMVLILALYVVLMILLLHYRKSTEKTKKKFRHLIIASIVHSSIVLILWIFPGIIHP